MATKGFALASGRDLFSIETAEQPLDSKSAITLSGQEAKHFYENVVKGASSRAGAAKDDVREQQRDMKSPRRARRRVGPPAGALLRGQARSERSTELLGLRLLRFAHEGDTSGLKDLMSKGVDINFHDTFFWTAMMCASWAGQRAAVRLLLRRGAAWVGVVDTQGRDAKDLALEGGHTGVVEELESYGRRSARPDANSDNRVSRTQWCDMCRAAYTSSLSSHLSSTLHQFSLRHPPTTPYYCLPPSSKSYQMMVRCGWKPGTGLGPEGEGPKQPVPTVLKRDQKGLGYGQIKRAKVTHFRARDRGAVRRPSKEEEQGRRRREEQKEASRRKEQEDRNLERDFRLSFYL